MLQPAAEHCGQKVAFYDFDGTLVTSNVVTRYAWYAWNYPSKLNALWRYVKTLLGVPFWIALDVYSRKLFNRVFFRQYCGMDRDWLLAQSQEMYRQEIHPRLYPFAKELVAQDKANGYHVVMVSGGLDFALQTVADYLEFDEILVNRLIFKNGVATGELHPPILAEQEKVEALKNYCKERGFEINQAKAYSDSASDLPMLLVVGQPVATNPDAKLKKTAVRNGWKILDLNQPISVT